MSKKIAPDNFGPKNKGGKMVTEHKPSKAFVEALKAVAAMGKVKKKQG